MNLERKELRPGVSVLELVGTISIGQDCQRLEQELDTQLDRQTSLIILDMTAIQKVDSAAIGTIVACYTRARSAGKTLRLAAAQGSVREVLRMMQLDHIVPMFETAGDAAEGFGASSQAAGSTGD